MTLFNRQAAYPVLWYEGLKLQPQHLESFENYIEALATTKSFSVQNNAWGLIECEFSFEGDYLSFQKLSGIFPNGTFFELADFGERIQQNFKISPEFSNTILYLTVSKGSGGHPTLQILHQLGNQPDPLCLPFCKIGSFTAGEDQKEIPLDQNFIPPLLHALHSSYLNTVINTTFQLLKNRADMLSNRLESPQQSLMVNFADWKLLEISNGYEAVLEQLKGLSPLHPEWLYRTLVQLTTDLAIHVTQKTEFPVIPSYQHTHLSETFTALFDFLEPLLNIVSDKQAFALPLKAMDKDLWSAAIPDKKLLFHSEFILAVASSLPLEKMKQEFPAQIKVAPEESLPTLISRSLSGIELSVLQDIPRQIPYYSDQVYFQLNKQNPFWKLLYDHPQLAIHIGSEASEVTLTLWAVQS